MSFLHNIHNPAGFYLLRRSPGSAGHCKHVLLWAQIADFGMARLLATGDSHAETDKLGESTPLSPPHCNPEIQSP